MTLKDWQFYFSHMTSSGSVLLHGSQHSVHSLKLQNVETFGKAYISIPSPTVWVAQRAIILGYIKLKFPGTILFHLSIWIMLRKVTMVVEYELPQNLVITRFPGFVGYYYLPNYSILACFHIQCSCSTESSPSVCGTTAVA